MKTFEKEFSLKTKLETLDYIFDKSNNKMTRDSGGAVAYALIEYFEQGKTGKVSE